MKIGDCVTLDVLRTSLVLLGIGLLTAACGGGGGGGSGDEMPGPTELDMPGNVGGSMMTQLGEWNVPMAGGLDVSDANSLLRAYYDSSVGHVVADAPVQPEGMERRPGPACGRVRSTSILLLLWLCLPSAWPRAISRG